MRPPGSGFGSKSERMPRVRPPACVTCGRARIMRTNASAALAVISLVSTTTGAVN